MKVIMERKCPDCVAGRIFESVDKMYENAVTLPFVCCHKCKGSGMVEEEYTGVHKIEAVVEAVTSE